MENKHIDIESRIYEYDNASEISDIYDGHLKKRAVRIDDNTDALNRRQAKTEETIKKTTKDSLIFGGLFRSLMGKDNHYFTYLNSSFEGAKKSEMVIPKFVSCFVKQAQGNAKGCYSECVGSRLANLLGVNTVYNMTLQSTEPDEFDDEYPDYDTIISVDYVPFGYTPETFEDLGIRFDEDTSLEKIFSLIDTRFKHIANEYGLEKSIDKLAQLKRDFAFQFLFRALVCEDYDFCSQNTAMLLGDSGDFKLAPCFDMELVFSGEKSAMYYKAFATETIEYMSEVMPEVLAEFMSRYGSAVKSGKLEDTILNTLKVQNYMSGPIAERLLDNYRRMSTIAHQCQNDREMQDE